MPGLDHTERWLPIPGFEGLYEASTLGRVKSENRTVMSANRWGPITKHLKEKILTQTTDNYGYLTVTLFRDGKSRPYRVHRLVGETFFGHRPRGQDTLHGSNGRQDNSISNLHYGTRAENEQDKIRDGTFNHGGGDKTAGELNGNSKLTATVVIEIRRQAAAGERQVLISQKFGITQAAVSLIVRRKTWKHVN